MLASDFALEPELFGVALRRGEACDEIHAGAQFLNKPERTILIGERDHSAIGYSRLAAGVLHEKEGV